MFLEEKILFRQNAYLKFFYISGRGAALHTPVSGKRNTAALRPCVCSIWEAPCAAAFGAAEQICGSLFHVRRIGKGDYNGKKIKTEDYSSRRSE